MGSWRVVSLAIGVVGLPACHHHTASIDPCDGGACISLPSCELGSCMTEATRLNDSPMAAAHSPMAGVEVEGGAHCPYVDGPMPPKAAVLNVSDIPEFKRGRSRRTNMDAGFAHPQSIELHAALVGVQAEILNCIDIAACYTEDLDPFAQGELDFNFELEPNGRVSAVSVVPSATLADPLVAACARRSVYEHRFPSYSGARMLVSYRVEITED